MLLGERIEKADSFRLTVHSSDLARVDNYYVGPNRPPKAGYELGYQIALPYQGLFSYFTGSRGWMIDATRTLCISPGWDFYEEKPIPSISHAAILVNPTFELVDEICGSRTSETNPAFVQASLPCSRQLKLLTHMLLRHPPGYDEPLRKDEWVISVLQQLQPPRASRTRSSNVVDRAKEALHAHSSDRLSLCQMANLVGVSAAYLTQEFTRSEGLPLYKYQLQLRLNRALLDLPHCDSITELALDLGFSSHSHFTSVFRKTFGMTPSQFRTGMPPSSRRSAGLWQQLRQSGAAEHRHAV